MKGNDLKEVSTLELFLELEKRRDVRYFNAGKHRPYNIQAKYGALPLEEGDEPVYALAVREKVFREWSLEQHMFNEQGNCRTDKKHYQITKKIKFPFSAVRMLFFFVLGCLIAHFIIGPLLFG